MAIRVFGSYADILKHQGTGSFVIAGALGRLSRATSGIGTILLVVGVTHSYALAGSVAAAIVIGMAAVTALWSRAMDSRGQLAVLPYSIAASILSGAALLLVVVLDAPTWTWFVAAFLVGAGSLDMGTLVRARWANVLTVPGQRHTALALESVNDELIFVIGPPLVTILATLINPVVGFSVGVGISVIGGISLLLQRSTAPIKANHADARPVHGGLLPHGVLGVMPLHLGVGIVFGAIDITAVGVARAHGQDWIAGIILAGFALGSVVSGLIFGPLSVHWSPRRRVLIAAVAYAIGVPLMVLVSSIWVLIPVVFIGGIVTTPMLIAGISLIEGATERHRLTEALTWPAVSLAVGVTLGAAVAGFVIDAANSWAGFWVTTAGALLVGGYGLISAFLRFLRRGHRIIGDAGGLGFTCPPGSPRLDSGS